MPNAFRLTSGQRKEIINTLKTDPTPDYASMAKKYDVSSSTISYYKNHHAKRRKPKVSKTHIPGGSTVSKKKIIVNFLLEQLTKHMDVV